MTHRLLLLAVAAACIRAADQTSPMDKLSGPAAQQSDAVKAMADSVEKQKAAIKTQLGADVTTDSFFSVPWTTPATIPIPNIIAPCGPMSETELQPLIADSAKAQDLQPDLIRSVIRHESASYPCAVSDKGALGLMQLMPDIAQQFNVDPLDARQNVQGGTRYLKQLMLRYKGDVKLALAAYNAGPQRVDADKKVPDIPETTAYVDAVLKDLNINSSRR